jgi:hypothetical protein
MNRSEPSCSGRHSPFLIGRDSHGCWVAQQQDGKSGGLFADRTQAIRFAMAENGRHPEDIIMVAGVLELNTQGTAQPQPRAA